MLDRLLEIIAGTRDFVLPDLDVSKDKARKSLFQLMKRVSSDTLADAIATLPMDTMKTIVNIEFTGKKAREREYILAQLMVTLIRISDLQEKYERQMHHPRRKVVAVIEHLVRKGEKFDWTKAAKNGFTVSISAPQKATTEAVDYFTGDTMRSITRRLKGYGIKPAAYKKLFQANDATFVDTEYSEKQRKGNKTGGQIKNAPRKRGTVLVTEEKRLVRFIQEVKTSLSGIEATVPQSRLLGSVVRLAQNSSKEGMKRADVTKSLKIVVKVRESLMDVVTNKANRVIISKSISLLDKAEEQLNIIRSRPTEKAKPKRQKAEAAVILRRLTLLSGE